MDYLPLFVDVANRRCLLVGAGEVAQRRLNWLIGAGAHVVVVAPDIGEEVRALCAGRGEIRAAPIRTGRRRRHVARDRSNRRRSGQSRGARCREGARRAREHRRRRVAVVGDLSVDHPSRSGDRRRVHRWPFADVGASGEITDRSASSGRARKGRGRIGSLATPRQ
jgi:hypothetical protein